MRAIRFHSYGGPDVLSLEDAPEPHPGPGQIRIRVSAASVNPVDWKVRQGYLAEMMPLQFPAITGRDAAGVVDEVGEGVSGVAAGDSVFGLGATGTAAEYTVLYAWATVPPTWTAEQAGAAGLAAAASQAAMDALGDLDGKTLLIEGAGGGVGTAAIQIAAARGARVIATAQPDSHDRLRALGATAVTTYGPGLPERVAELAPLGVDAVIDIAGSGSLTDLIAIAGAADRVVSLADFTAAAHGVRLIPGDANAQTTLASAASLGAEGRFLPQVVATYPLDRTAEAQSLIQHGHTHGKLVLIP